MGFLNKKLLIALLALLLAGGLAGCDLLSSVTTTQPVTTASTAASTTEPTTALTTTAPQLTTTVHNVAILLSGTWKTVYDFGSPFDPTGLVVTLLRSDSSETVVGEYFVLGYNSSAPGLQTVRIRYAGLEAEFVVYVKEATVLEDVALVLDLPDKLVYQPGQTADWTGLAVRVVQSDGDRIELTPAAYELSGFDSSEPGLVTITVTYGDLTAAFPIYVAETAVGGISLSVVPPIKTVYDEGQAFSVAGMVVTLSVPGETPITLASGQYAVDAPDTDVVGTHDVAVTALGLTAWFSITVNSTSSVLDLMPYYDAAEGLTGTQLANALRTIITTGYVGYNYSGTTGTTTQVIIAVSDKDPGRTGNYLIDIYTGKSLSSVWDSGATWNKEHVWPQSLLGCTASGINTCSDVHNLKPSSPSINSQRSNDWFASVIPHDSSTLVDDDSYASGSTFNYENETYDYFEPRNEVKGDIARILFYMAIRYQMTLVELNPGQTPAIYQMGDLSTLLAWNLADPVDDFERNRNEVIYSYQHNRNPFIDYPELADLIWG
ncbi:MAG: endonuclease [Candidatus Izemoplasmatales bacterium]